MDIMSNLRKLYFVDHDMKKHRDMDHQNYMDIVQNKHEAPKWFVAKEWARGLEQYGILSLLYMPHFVHNIPINTYFKKLLVFFHGGFLWLGKPIPIDVELIAIITCLPFTWMDPTPLLKKDQEVATAARMKEKYDVVRNKRGFLFDSINNYTVLFASKVLAS